MVLAMKGTHKKQCSKSVAFSQNFQTILETFTLLFWQPHWTTIKHAWSLFVCFWLLYLYYICIIFVLYLYLFHNLSIIFTVVFWQPRWTATNHKAHKGSWYKAHNLLQPFVTISCHYIALKIFVKISYCNIALKIFVKILLWRYLPQYIVTTLFWKYLSHQ